MIYEAVLLFGILFSAIFVFDLFHFSAPENLLETWRQLYLFIVLGIYFTYFWGKTGQTLAMQTWHIKVVSSDNTPITFRQSCIRYLGCWMWFFPSLIFTKLTGIHHGWLMVLVIIIGIVIWGMTCLLDTNKQFLHDKFAKTQLISVPKKPRVPDTE